MSLEQQVIDLTQATEQLLQAVNTRKADLDTAETNASLSAQEAASAAGAELPRAAALDITEGGPLTRIAQLGLSLCPEPEVGESGA